MKKSKAWYILEVTSSVGTDKVLAVSKDKELMMKRAVTLTKKLGNAFHRFYVKETEIWE